MTKILSFIGIIVVVLLLSFTGGKRDFSNMQPPTNIEAVNAIKEFCWDTTTVGGWYIRFYNGIDSIHRITVVEIGPAIFYDTLWVYPVEGFGVFYDKDVIIDNRYEKSVWYITFILTKNGEWWVYDVSDTIDVSLLKRERLQ